MRSSWSWLAALGFGALCSCASQPQPRPAHSEQAAASTSSAIVVPETIEVNALPRTRVAAGLLNPRGMNVLPSGELLLSEAGTGLADDLMSGRLLRLRDVNADGDFLDEGERTVLLDKQPSKNILEIVRRDEVFGLAGMAEGDGKVMVALAFFGGPSTIFQIGEQVVPWTTTHGNINDIAFDPTRKQWYGASSTTDEVVQLRPGRGAERVIKLPPLENGQDPVPAYLGYDPITGEILVTLFTGSPEGEEGGAGTELVPRAGGVIAVNPERRSFRWLVRGLSVPTDLEIAPDGTIYVLEFCSAFLDPIGDAGELFARPSHGGFKRFSGRLLRIERPSGRVSVLAEQLDAPTNLALGGGALYVAQGMGTPGREIPTPSGTTKLEGFVERIPLP